MQRGGGVFMRLTALAAAALLVLSPTLGTVGVGNTDLDAEVVLANKAWSRDIYVVSENVETHGSPFLRSGLYQRSPHNRGPAELTHITQALATGSINVAGVSLVSGLVSFFRSFSAGADWSPGGAGVAALFGSLNTRDTFFIVYTHRAVGKTQTETLWQLLQYCGGGVGGGRLESLDAAAGAEPYSYVFVGQCSADHVSERSVWNERLTHDYLPVRVRARKFSEGHDWFINATVDALEYPSDYYVAGNRSVSFNFKPPHFSHHAGFTFAVGLVDVFDENGDYLDINVSMCANERAEDGADRMARQVGNNDGIYEIILSHICRLINNNRINDVQGLYRGCDGQPPSRIVGVIEKHFYVRSGYTVDEVYACYCTVLEGSNCITELAGPSPERTYIAQALASDAARQQRKEAGDGESAGEVAISLGVTCSTAILGVSLGWRERKSQGYLTGPFDLMLSNYDGVVRCIQDDFRYFTDSQYLEVFDFELDYEAYYESERKGNEGSDAPFYISGPYIRNTYYNFVFPHESPVFVLARLGENYTSPDEATKFVENDFLKFKELYRRRISNFRNYMKSEMEKRLMLTASVNNVSQLEAAIMQQYPSATFRTQIFLKSQNAFAYQTNYYHLNLLNATSYIRW